MKKIFVFFCLIFLFVNSSFSHINFEISEEKYKSWKKLLHYKNGKSLIEKGSDFFLNENGNTDPIKELESTLLFFKESPLNKCLYPARYYLLFNKKIGNECFDFNEYNEYVPFDSVSLVLASESETSPVSSMGHIFIVAEGFNKFDLLKRHSSGFVANASTNSSLLFQFLTDSIDGLYTLSPYNDTIYNYINNENRSLWELDLNMTSEEKYLLKMHLYELKSHQIKYSFFTYNCATGTNSILSVVSDDFDYSNKMNIASPIEYAKNIFENSGRVTKITVRPSEIDQYRLNKGYNLNPLLSPKPSRFTIGYTFNSYQKNGIRLSFLPAISDFKEDIKSKNSLNESRLFETTALIYGDTLLIDRITLFNIKSFPNILIDKYKVNFGLSFHGEDMKRHTSLYPDFYVGSAISFFETGLRPFISTDVGNNFTKYNSNPYIKISCGSFLQTNKYGRIYIAANRIFSKETNTAEYTKRIDISYSKNLDNDNWISTDLSFGKNGKGNFKKIDTNISYRF